MGPMAELPAPPAGGSAKDARTLELRKGDLSPKQLAGLQQVGRGFDSMFAHTLLGELMKPLQGSGFGGSGPGSSVVEGLIQTQLADRLSAGKGLGIGALVVRQMAPFLAGRQVTLEELTRGLSAAGSGTQAAAQAAAAAPSLPIGEGK